MEHLKDILLTERQKEFISGLINFYGTGEHPWCGASTFDLFTIEYVQELMELPEVMENLSVTGIETFMSVKDAIENPKTHYVVTVNSLWDYDRSLDDSRFTIGLKVNEDMPYEAYGIEYFNGRVFRPHVRNPNFVSWEPIP